MKYKHQENTHHLSAYGILWESAGEDESCQIWKGSSMGSLVPRKISFVEVVIKIHEQEFLYLLWFGQHRLVYYGADFKIVKVRKCQGSEGDCSFDLALPVTWRGIWKLEWILSIGWFWHELWEQNKIPSMHLACWLMSLQTKNFTS